MIGDHDPISPTLINGLFPFTPQEKARLREDDNVTHRVSTRSSEGLERLNERRLLEIRSADLDRSLEIFSCTSFLRPFIL